MIGSCATAVPAIRARAAAPAAGSGDIRDDFDYALEFVETARKALPSDPAKAETMATSLLMAKRQIARAQAVDLVKRAVHYLNR